MIRSYRVWDKQEKTYSDRAFSIDQFGICYVQDEDGYWEEIDDSRFIVEFDTDLKDKNDKEIFEGDIVKRVIQVYYSMPDEFYDDKTTDEEREKMKPKREEYAHEWSRGVAVRWDDDAVGFQPFVHGCGLCGKNAPLGEEVVIIGNIHEDLELLDDAIHDPYGPIGEENIGGESRRMHEK